VSYGDWAQWRRRSIKCGEDGRIMYVTCPVHHVPGCTCPDLHGYLEEWLNRHGATGGPKLTTLEAGHRAAGLVPADH